MIGFIFFPFQSQHCVPKANTSTSCSWELCPWTKMHGQHVQHVKPLYPKPCVCWHHCKEIRLLLLHQQFFASLAPTWVHNRGDVGLGLFSIGKGPSHISHHTILPSWGDVGRRWQVSLRSLFFPIWGKLFHLAVGKHQIQWVSKKEQARLSVLALGEIHLGVGRPEIQLLLQGLFMCLKIKQPMVLATGIQVSPLPGECPDPRAAQSCSLLPSGASGFDFYF